MSRNYVNPPIVEALCEIRFAPQTPWDMTIPGLLYGRIREQYPKRQESKQSWNIIVKDEGISHEAGSPLVRFQRADGKQLVQVGPHFVSIHRVKPYESWEEFYPGIELVADACLSELTAPTIQGVALRYLNHISIPEPSVNLDQYFHLTPGLDETLPQQIDFFMIGVQFPMKEGSNSLKITMQSVPSGDTNTSKFSLDLSYFTVSGTETSLGWVRDWLNEAHNEIEEIFESCITDKLRECFQ